MKKNPLSLLRNAFSAVFGKFNWSSPSWMTHLQTQAQASPKMFWGKSALIILFLIGAGYTAHWYKNLPTPVYTTAVITAPAITPNAETLVPNNLIVDFGIKNNGFINKSVAPLDHIGKIITQGIELSPADSKVKCNKVAKVMGAEN